MQPGLGNPSNQTIEKDVELLKSTSEIGNLSLNRINLLGMLQRAFNSQLKKNSPLPALSRVEKLCPGSARERAAERRREGREI